MALDRLPAQSLFGVVVGVTVRAELVKLLAEARVLVVEGLVELGEDLVLLVDHDARVHLPIPHVGVLLPRVELLLLDRFAGRVRVGGRL